MRQIGFKQYLLALFLYLSLCLIEVSPTFAAEKRVKQSSSSSANHTLSVSQIRFKALKHPGLDRLGGQNTIAQDEKGFIWFGGMSGLARYDGYELKVFRHEPSDVTSLSSSYINKILIDTKGVMWVATGEGLNRYDALNENFVRVDQKPSEPDNDWLNATWDVIESQSGDLYIATDSGISRYIPSSNSFVNYRPSDKNAPGMSDRLSTCLLEDNKGRIWIGKRQSGLEMFDPASNKFHHFPHIPGDRNSLSHMEVSSVFEDRYGTIWVGTFGGLDKFDEASGRFVQYIHDPSDNKTLSGNIISSITEDRTGNLIIGTDGAGINYYNRADNNFIRFDDSKGLLNTKVKSLYEDNNGGLWVGHFPTGISLLDQYASAFQNFRHEETNPNSLSHSDIMAIAEDKRGNIWVGTDGGGLNYIDRQRSTITRYIHDASNPNSLSANPVLSVIVDKDQTLWAGTWQGGLNKLVKGSQKFIKYKNDPSDPNSLGGGEVWAIYQTKDGVIWIGTEKGLSYYDEENDSFKHYRYDPEKANTIHEGPVTVIYEDRLGILWVAGYMGLTKMDRKSETFETFRPEEGNPNSISDRTIIGIYEDPNGNLWASTSSAGFNLVNRNNNTFKAYTAKDGLPDDGVAGILADESGYLWFSTGRGISRFDYNTETFRNFTVENGLPGNLSKRPAAIKTMAGELAFGTTKGLTIFNPNSVAENKYIPPLVITDFQIFNKPVEIKQDEAEDDYPLRRSISYADQLVLNHKQSVFSIKFAALNYLMPEKNLYAYMLEGFEEDWNYVEHRRMATYTNLDSGTYTLRIKGSNNEGIWNEDGTSIQIKVLPPWWETWWAYMLYCLAVLAAILRYVYYQHEKRQIVIEQNRLLEVKVAERTSELRRKNHDIQGMLSNMRQGLFTVDKDCLIHPEYSKHLESIFERKDLAGIHLKTLLFDNAKIGSDTLNQIVIAAQSMVGEEEMNFEFNHHLLIDEYDVEIGGANKHLSLDWNPILDGYMIDKLMVTVRDVTQLRVMESEAESHRRELELISQVLAVPSSKFVKFKNSSMAFLEKNKRYIKSTDKREDHIVALLFRNMHTIKGNCRTFGFSFLSDVAHDVESVYSEFKTSETSEWNQQELLDGVERVAVAFEEYEQVYNNILGGNEVNSGADSDYLLAAAKIVEELQDNLDRIENGEINEFNSQDLKAIVDKNFSSKLELILEDIVDSLPSISEQLGKPSPVVYFVESDVKIKNTAHELINNVFAHVLRNSIDHGIEPPEERKSLNKPEKGKIEINLEITPAGLTIAVMDDGRGLNIKRLREKGVEVGKWSEKDSPALDEITELVFASGVSTKEAVTDISGRGVGMDAVKQFLKDNHCEIYLKVISDDYSKDFLPFKTVIVLPASMYVLG